jgi:hypothetical protein
MANYHEVCVREISDKETGIGVGLGTDSEGRERICISFEGAAINLGIDPEWRRVNWTSLTLERAAELYRLLDGIKHVWTGVEAKRSVDVRGG